MVALQHVCEDFPGTDRSAVARTHHHNLSESVVPEIRRAADYSQSLVDWSHRVGAIVINNWVSWTGATIDLNRRRSHRRPPPSRFGASSHPTSRSTAPGEEKIWGGEDPKPLVVLGAEGGDEERGRSD
ncbi:hypothetical protein AKJ16_DCAP07097 [Drosera capensis]